MKTMIKKDHILFRNDDGEYHLSKEKFKTLGKAKAIKFAETEINKKKNSTYTKKTITFKDAKNLGFCEYGIEDFCKDLDLDISKEYSLDFLADILTVRIIDDYSDECFQLFGKNTFKAFGGALGYLDREDSKIDIVLRSGAFSDHTLYLMACDFALSCLHNFENIYPDDKRSRLAIEARLDWLEGKITDEHLKTAAQAAQAARTTCCFSSIASAYPAAYAVSRHTYSSSAAAASYASSAAAAAAYYSSAAAAAAYCSSAAIYYYYSGAYAQKEYVRFMLIIELNQK